MRGYEELTIADVEKRNARIGKRSLTAPVSVAAAAEEPVAIVRSKYRNVRTVIDGEKFDSKREAERWQFLRARQQLGEISDLQRQVSFPLYAPVMDETGSKSTGVLVQVSEYRADFVYIEDGKQHVEDSKGKRTKEYQRSKKWLELQQRTVIEEV